MIPRDPQRQSHRAGDGGSPRTRWPTAGSLPPPLSEGLVGCAGSPARRDCRPSVHRVLTHRGAPQPENPTMAQAHPLATPRTTVPALHFRRRRRSAAVGTRHDPRCRMCRLLTASRKPHIDIRCPNSCPNSGHEAVNPGVSRPFAVIGERTPRRTKPQVTRAMTCGSESGQGRGRTADLPIFSRTLVPTELPGRACWSKEITWANR